jgi:hypothetical protein
MFEKAAAVGFEPTEVFTHQINSLDRSATTATQHYQRTNQYSPLPITKYTIQLLQVKTKLPNKLTLELSNSKMGAYLFSFVE